MIQRPEYKTKYTKTEKAGNSLELFGTGKTFETEQNASSPGMNVYN